MSIVTSILFSALAVFCGFWAHQTVENLINAFLSLLPLNIRTVS